MPDITNQYQADRRRMKAYIASRIPKDGIDVVLAEGKGGDICVQLDPVRYDDGEWDLHWETNVPEWVDLREICEHFRRQEMSVEECGREFGRGRVSSGNGKLDAPGPEVSVLRQELADLKDWLGKHFSSVFSALAQKQPTVKDKYTPAEVAVIVARRPYTVREWCRYGRIRAEKVNGVGRGSEESWRISHAELDRYLNEGLLPGVRPKY